MRWGQRRRLQQEHGHAGDGAFFALDLKLPEQAGNLFRRGGGGFLHKLLPGGRVLRLEVPRDGRGVGLDGLLQGRAGVFGHRQGAGGQFPRGAGETEGNDKKSPRKKRNSPLHASLRTVKSHARAA